jgi:hypothetical protein
MEGQLPVDSFKYLPRLIARLYQMTDRQPEYPIPWTPVERDLAESKFGLITSAGLFHAGTEPPFDLERELEEPEWGDPTFRLIPSSIKQSELGASHLHINTEDLLTDMNIQLPIHRFQELAADRIIGGVAEVAVSFMGYQGFPPDTMTWQETYGPQVAEIFRSEGVNNVLLTPA